MAKPKKYISSKLKVKRKFVLGGDPGQELYLNGNTTYQAVDAPTSLLQNQFDAEEQARAKQMSAIYGQQLANQLVINQDINQASEQRKKNEEQAKAQTEQQTIQNAQKQLTTAASLAGKEVAKTVATTGTATSLPSNTAGAVLSKADAKMLGVKSASRFAGQGVSKFSYGSNLANLGVGVGLGLIGEGIGYFGNKRDDKQMEEQGRSQYYDDTNYSRAEFNSQLGKSTFKGAGMGSSFGPVGTAIGAGVGLAYGLGKAIHERRQTKSEDERGVKIGNKRFGKKLLFGEENVYDENLDPTVIEKRNQEAQLKAMGETAAAMDTARLGSMTQYDTNTGFNLKTTTGQMAKYGGKIEYLQGGVAKSLGRGAKEYIGKSHEEGGIDLPGNIEVEGGETEQNNYIFSKHLKLHTGISYAQAHKNLLASGASSEEIKQLALSQEAAAGRNPNEIKTMKFAKYGGPLEYDKGGEKQTLKERRKERLVNKFNEKYDAQIQKLAGLPEDQRAIRFQEMVNEFAIDESVNNEKIKDAQNFGKDDIIRDLFSGGIVGGLTGAYTMGPVGLPIGIGLGVGAGAIKTFKNYITSKRGTSRHLDKLEAKQTAGKNFEDNLINNPKGELANKYTEEFFKKHPEITNANDYLKYLQSTDAANEYDLATTVAAGKYLQGRLEDQQNALQNPPVPMKGKDAGRLPRTQAPKLATYTLPNVKPGTTSSTFVPDEEEVPQNIEVKTTNNPIVNQTPIGVAPPATNQESNYKQQLGQALTNSGLSAEEFAKQNGIDVGLLNDIISGNKTLTADEAGLLGAAITTKPVNSTGYSVPVDNKGNPKAVPTANSNPDAPTINNQLSTFQNIAKTTGALDFTSPDVAGGIWAGDKYENEWKPLVARTMSDDANADKVIAYLENYSGQDAADVKARIAGKPRDEQIRIINKLATDKQVGPFHNAVLEGINSTREYNYMKPLEPKPFPREEPKIVPYTIPKPPLPNLPEYKNPNLGWAQAIPAIAALGTNIKPAQYTPALASEYVTPGAVGRTNIGRISLNTYRAENQGNLSAMNQALQNMAGPGAVAGMLAAKTKADQQSLAIANAEQNQNTALAAKEADLNAGISKFNVGAAMQAQTTNAGIGVQNAAMQNEARRFNAASKLQTTIDNRDTKLSAGQHAIDSYLTYDMDKRKLAAAERVARAQDYSGALYREEIFNRAKRASQDPNNKDFYGKSDAELWDYTRQYDTRMHGERGNVIYADANKNNQDQKKFGGAKKYISRLGDLKNAKYKV